jgi:hypothetical protein
MVATKRMGDRADHASFSFSFFPFFFLVFFSSNVTLASSVTHSAYIQELCRAGGFATDGRGPAPASTAAAVAVCIMSTPV